MMKDCMVAAYDPESKLEFDAGVIDFDPSFIEKSEKDFETGYMLNEAPMRCKDFCENKVMETGLTENEGEEKYWDKVGECVQACINYVVEKQDEDQKCRGHWATFLKSFQDDRI